MTALRFDRLTKAWPGGRGIFDLDLAVDGGEFFGFIGENGAGKSTSIRAALGLLTPSAGRVELFGRVIDDATRADVGYVPAEPGLWDGMTVGEALSFLGSLHRLDPAPRRRVLLDALELDPGRRASDLSLGNKKKVALVAALQHQPRLLILDEPSNGLDPLMQQRLFGLLHEEQQRGATIFFSSHVLAEVERCCSRVAILKQGRLVQLASVDELRARQTRRVELRPAAAATATLSLPGVSSVVIDQERAHFRYGGPMPPLMRALADDGVHDVAIERPSLEEIVLSHYGQSGANHVSA